MVHGVILLLILYTVIKPHRAGRWVTLTTDSSAYQMANGRGVPVTGRSHVILEVKVCQGAEIQIMEDLDGAWVYYRLGGGDNEWSAASASEKCDEYGCSWLDTMEIPTLDCASFVPFWLTWDSGGRHELGGGDIPGIDTHLSGQVITGFDINIVQVSNFDENITAEWRFLIDDPPVFTLPSPMGVTAENITEDTPVGSTVYTVAGADPEGDGLIFSLESHPEVFELEGTAVKIKQGLDFETTAAYSLVLSLTDGRNTVRASVMFYITDVIDEAPSITLSSSLALPEEMSVGTVVTGLFSVDDKDRGDVLTYSISGPNSNLFLINPLTGELSIAERIDRDEMDLTNVTFDLKVKDSGDLQTSQTLIITIIDLNDNQPTFSSSFYSLDVPENAPSDTPLLDFAITDVDSSTNAAYTIMVTAGDDVTPKFKVSGNQLQTTANVLDYESLYNTSYTYTLTVVAVNLDNIMTGSTFVAIKVTPENEYDPVFKEPQLDGSNNFPGQPLAEDVSLNYVITFTVSDDDLGADGDVIFSIVSVLDSNGEDGKDKFTIGHSDGQLRVVQSLDSDPDTGGVLFYDVTIRATDGGDTPRASEGTLRLIITNVNDNAPQFDVTFYTATVAEDAGVGSYVGDVTTSDADRDDVTYSVVGSWSSVFEMSGKTVVTNSLLDYSSTPVYVITIRAEDGTFQTDVPMTVSVAVITATIFEITARQNVEIREEQGAGTVIPGVFKMVGNTGAVTYSLEGINAPYLSVNPASGEITYGSQRINRDGESGMTTLSDVTLKGIDGVGDVAIAHLSFIITDINDNAPEPSVVAATVDVIENSAANQLLMPITLSDLDVGQNGVVTMVIHSGNGDGHFSVVDNDLYVNGSNIDFEALPETSFTLVLLAVDSPLTSTPLTSAIQVMVNVLGENEFSPIWESPTIDSDSYFSDIRILETVEPGTTLETFVASDDDGGEDGRVTFSLVGTEDDAGPMVTGKFALTSDGKLVVTSSLGYDVIFYIVTLAVVDSSVSSPKTATGHIKVFLQDDSTNSNLANDPMTSSSTSMTELWVMRSLVAVFGVAILALVSYMFKTILTKGTSTKKKKTTSKVYPRITMERPVSVTPHLSMESVRIPAEEDHFSWIEREDSVASLPYDLRVSKKYAQIYPRSGSLKF